MKHNQKLKERPEISQDGNLFTSIYEIFGCEMSLLCDASRDSFCMEFNSYFAYVSYLLQQQIYKYVFEN